MTLPASEETVPATDAEPLDAQINRLAEFIMQEVSGEPSQSQGAIDTAIRLIRVNIEDANIGRSIISVIGDEICDPTSPLHNWSPAERYDEVITDLVEMVRKSREQAVRECAEAVWNLPANTGEYVRRHDADAVIKSLLLPKPLSLSQVSVKK